MFGLEGLIDELDRFIVPGILMWPRGAGQSQENTNHDRQEQSKRENQHCIIRLIKNKHFGQTIKSANTQNYIKKT